MFKKWASIIGAVGIIAGSSISVVSCGNSNNNTTRTDIGTGYYTNVGNPSFVLSNGDLSIRDLSVWRTPDNPTGQLDLVNNSTSPDLIHKAVDDSVNQVLNLYNEKSDKNFVLYIGSTGCPYCRIFTDGLTQNKVDWAFGATQHKYTGALAQAAQLFNGEGFNTYMWEDFSKKYESLPWDAGRVSTKPDDPSQKTKPTPADWLDYWSAKDYQDLLAKDPVNVSSTPWIIVSKNGKIVYQGAADSSKYYDPNQKFKSGNVETELLPVKSTPKVFVDWINSEIAFKFPVWAWITSIVGGIFLLLIAYLIYARVRRNQKINQRKKIIRDKLAEARAQAI